MSFIYNKNKVQPDNSIDGLWDTLTSAISSTPKLSFGKYTLADLTQTSTGAENVPTDPTILNNLKKLATDGLTMLENKIGKFKLLSAYRSQDTQDALKTSGNKQAAPTSLHTQGIAADLAPTTMSAAEYMRKIAADESVRNALGEIAVKDNALHISLPTPTKRGVLMYVDAADKYIKMSLNDALTWAGKNRMKAAATGGAGILLVAGLIGLFFYMKSKKK